MSVTTERHGISATVLLDSLLNGRRVTTFAIRIPKFINAEFNTHRVFSRNFASSRAINTESIICEIERDPYFPAEVFATEKKMCPQVRVENPRVLAELRGLLKAHLADTIKVARAMSDLGIHKQTVNRYLEPFMYQSGIVTSCDYSNFFALRCSPYAQPEIRKLATEMRALYEESRPIERAYHIPLVDAEDEKKIGDLPADAQLHERVIISAARAARISYGNTDVDAGHCRAIYETLIAKGHMSQLEHQCRAMTADEVARGMQFGNLPGCVQYRHVVAGHIARF